MKFTPRQHTALLLFVGLFGCYLSLSPTAVAGMGYVGEEMRSADRIITIMHARVKGVQIPPMIWSRHGPLPVLFDIPFVATGKFVISPDFVLSFQPVLLTALLVTVLYLWLRKLASPAISMIVTLAGAFGTMLWPYAYIGLEPKQSLCVLLAGYLALTCGPLRDWPRLILFAIVCGLTVSLKLSGFVLGPAIVWVIFIQFRNDWRLRKAHLATVLLVIGAIYLAAAIGREGYWHGVNGMQSVKPFLVDSIFSLFGNAIGVFGSPTKGLFVYAPILLMALYAVPKAFRAHWPLVIFALLIAAPTLAQVSMFRAVGDEVWGPRYMHTVVAPFLVVIGAAWPKLRWPKTAPMLALALMGGAISFLGALYYYGVTHSATTSVGQNTIEWITSDVSWNAIRFHASLFETWLRKDNQPVPWTPPHIWIWSPPQHADAWKTIDLRAYCQPQAFLLRFWSVPTQGTARVLFFFYLGSLALGIVCLAWGIWGAIQESPPELEPAAEKLPPPVRAQAAPVHK